MVVYACPIPFNHIYWTGIGQRGTDHPVIAPPGLLAKLDKLPGPLDRREVTAMARTVRDAKLESRSARSQLKMRGKPYYRSIDPGIHLGYRKGKAGGKWVVRWYVGNEDYK